MESKALGDADARIQSLRAHLGTAEDQPVDSEIPRQPRLESEEQLRRMMDYAPECIVMLDIDTGRFLDVNPMAEELFGLPRSKLLQVGPFDLSPTDQPDGPSQRLGRERIMEAVRGSVPVFEWWHCNGQGERFPCEVRLVRMPWGDREVVRGTIIDISDRKRLEIGERGRSEVLEKIARGEPLPQVLRTLVAAVERVLPGMICSVLLLDAEKQTLHLGAAPGLPDFYNDAIEGLRIGPEVGCCGAAAYHRHRVVARDVATHPNWTLVRELATRAGLRACWSEPVISLSGDVLGTLALYYREPRDPMAVELRVIETAAQLASIAIEHDHTQRLVEYMNETLRQRVAERTRELEETNRALQAAQDDLRLAAVSFETNDSIIITDHVGRILRVNSSFTRTTGYLPEEVVGKTTGFLRSDQHDQKYYLQLWAALKNRGHWEGEIWSRRKCGEIFPQRLTISCVKNALGQITNYVADGQDITEEKKAAADESAIRIARQVQQGLFPATMPRLCGYDISGAVRPAERASGDYFDFISFQRNQFGVVVADISGHGLGPALLMAQLQAYVRALSETSDDPAAILTNANRLFSQSEVGRFATLFLGQIDLVNRVFNYASAAQEGHIIRRNGDIETLDATTIPLGVEEDTLVPCGQKVQLAPGDLILLPTDGIEETFCDSRRFFGKEPMLEVARANRHRTAGQIIEALFGAARKFAAGLPQRDDMTAVVCKVVEE